MCGRTAVKGLAFEARSKVPACRTDPLARAGTIWRKLEMGGGHETDVPGEERAWEVVSLAERANGWARVKGGGLWSGGLVEGALVGE